MYLNLEQIHSLWLSVETKAEPLFQSNISLYPNFEVKVPLKYTFWHNSTAFVIKCFSLVMNIKENIIQILCVVAIFMWLMFYITLSLEPIALNCTIVSLKRRCGCWLRPLQLPNMAVVRFPPALGVIKSQK